MAIKTESYRRLICPLVCAVVLISCSLSAQEQGQSPIPSDLFDAPPSPVREQPDDPFIDLLRHRLGHNVVHSFVTVTDGQPYIEAVALTNFTPEDILHLYATAFSQDGHLARVTRLHPEYDGLMFFHGEINGLEKKLILLQDPRSGMTRVRFYSEQGDPRILNDFPSLTDKFPELRQLSRSAAPEQQHSTLREYHHGPLHHGVLHLSLNMTPDVARNRIVEFLRENGWRTAEGSVGHAMFMRKDGWLLHGVISRNPPRSAHPTTVLLKLSQAE